jgi:DNA-binding PadR family transcriptional regulator
MIVQQRGEESDEGCRGAGVDTNCERAQARRLRPRSGTRPPLPRIGRLTNYYVLRYIAAQTMSEGDFKDLGRWSEPALLVLSSLAGGPKHGYAITRDVSEILGTELGPGTLYGALARLEERGLIEALPVEERRRPYRLTASGARALEQRLRALERVAGIGLDRLHGAGPGRLHGAPA